MTAATDLGVCWWCRINDADGMDHLTPKSRGGTNDPSNLVPACDRCNNLKGNKTPAEYGAWLRQRAAVMAATCSYCGKGPGEGCVTRHKMKTQPHPQRREAALRAGPIQ